MTATANEKYRQLVQTLYSSQLHFHLSETPFSAQILLRKKLLKDRTSESSPSFHLQTETVHTKVLDLQKKLDDSNEIIKILQAKSDQAESKALKVYNEKKLEIEMLKNSIKKCNLEMRNLKKDIDDEKKLVRQKEKIIQKLEHKCDNLITENKHVKTELCKVKNETKKLSKNKNTKQQPAKNLPVPTHQTRKCG